MIKTSLLLIALLLSVVVTLTLHYQQHNRAYPLQKLQEITQLTHLGKLSLSVGYQESLYNPSYPEMPSLKKMDFIYEE